MNPKILKVLGDHTADTLLSEKQCVECDKPFANRQEKDEAILVRRKGNHLSFMHKKCWHNQSEFMQNVIKELGELEKRESEMMNRFISREGLQEFLGKTGGE